MQKSKGKQSLGDRLNELEAETLDKYKAIMGEMTDLEAVIALKWLFEDSIPSYELAEIMETVDVQRQR